MRKRPVLAACRAQRTATIVRLAGLEPADWDRPCLPSWRVRDVAAHLVAIDEGAVTGRLLPVLARAPDRAAIERWNEASIARYAALTPGDLLGALSAWGQRLQRVGRVLPSLLLQTPVRGPFGRLPLVYLLYRRVVDEWVHECDVAAVSAPQPVPLVPAEPAPVVGDALTAAVLVALPRLALPAIPLARGVVRLTVDAQAPPDGGPPGETPRQGVARHVWGIDFARRHFGPRVTTPPDALVRTTAGVLTLMAEDRLRWADVRDELLVIEGDEALAAAVLDALPPRRPGAR
jgi:hypothetical protein